MYPGAALLPAGTVSSCGAHAAHAAGSVGQVAGDELEQADALQVTAGRGRCRDGAVGRDVAGGAVGVPARASVSSPCGYTLPAYPAAVPGRSPACGRRR